VLGILLILLTFVLPGGIVAGVRKMRARVVRVTPAPPSSPAGADSTPPREASDSPDQIGEQRDDPNAELEDVPATTAPPG